MVFSGDSVILKILKSANINYVEFVNLFQKDSLSLTESDRYKILSFIKNSTHNKFVIIHGTSKLVETAKFLSKESINGVVILVGSMKPFLYCKTEASFNLGCAIGFAKSLSQGVWIVMNGSIFEPDNCVKNISTGIFERIK